MTVPVRQVNLSRQSLHWNIPACVSPPMRVTVTEPQCGQLTPSCQREASKWAIAAVSLVNCGAEMSDMASSCDPEYGPSGLLSQVYKCDYNPNRNKVRGDRERCQTMRTDQDAHIPSRFLGLRALCVLCSDARIDPDAGITAINVASAPSCRQSGSRRTNDEEADDEEGGVVGGGDAGCRHGIASCAGRGAGRQVADGKADAGAARRSRQRGDRQEVVRLWRL